MIEQVESLLKEYAHVGELNRGHNYIICLPADISNKAASLIGKYLNDKFGVNAIIIKAGSVHVFEIVK